MPSPTLSLGARRTLFALAVLAAATIAVLIALLLWRIERGRELRAHPQVSDRLEDTLAALGDDGAYALEYSPDDLRNFPMPLTTPEGRLIHVPAHRHELEHMAPPRRPVREDMLRIVFAGGSTSMAYPRYAAEALRRRGFAIEPHTLGVPGSISGTTALFLQRFLTDWEPNVVVVYHGFNDINFIASHRAFASLDVEGKRKRAFDTLGSYYAEMLDFCGREKCRLVVSTFAAPDLRLGTAQERRRYEVLFREIFPWIGTPARYASLLREYNRMVRDFAQREGIPLIEVAEQHPAQPKFFRDECHRTRDGTVAHGEIVAAALAPLLEKLGGGGAVSAARE